MLQILDEVLENLYSRNNTPLDLRTNAPSAFERKKAIIARSLYGVEVKRWAVWINHLRLWLALFVDMPDEAKMSNEPLLPNLTFKVRTGDSLVQRIGSKTFSVRGSASLPSELKERIRKLKDRKTEFYYNNSKDYRSIEQEELALFRAILDREIAERRKIISTLDESNREQLQLFETRAEQKRLDFTHQIERLHAEITELGAQRRSLADERPFIWSIEFPEVFFDRGGFDIIIGNPRICPRMKSKTHTVIWIHLPIKRRYWRWSGLISRISLRTPGGLANFGLIENLAGGRICTPTSIFDRCGC